MDLALPAPQLLNTNSITHRNQNWQLCSYPANAAENHCAEQALQISGDHARALCEAPAKADERVGVHEHVSFS